MYLNNFFVYFVVSILISKSYMVQSESWPRSWKCQDCWNDVHCERHRMWKLHKWKKRAQPEVMLVRSKWHNIVISSWMTPAELLFGCPLLVFDWPFRPFLYFFFFKCRIERLWRDVWTGVTHIYYDVLHSLEEDGFLNISDSLHLFCAHYTFLPRLKGDLAKFSAGWNDHSIRTEHSLSPNQLWELGMLQHPIREPQRYEENLAVE